MNKPKPVFYDSSLDTKVDWVVAMLEEMASVLEEMRAGATIRAAILEEREACARIAEGLTGEESGCCQETTEQLAAIIRGRP